MHRASCRCVGDEMSAAGATLWVRRRRRRRLAERWLTAASNVGPPTSRSTSDVLFPFHFLLLQRTVICSTDRGRCLKARGTPWPITGGKVKVKVGRAPPERRRGAHLPFKAIEPVGGWTTESVTHGQCDARSYSYLPGCRASPPFGRYQIILLGDRGTWVWTICPELLLGSGLAGSWTRDLSITSQRPNHWATEPLSHPYNGRWERESRGGARGRGRVRSEAL